MFEYNLLLALINLRKIKSLTYYEIVSLVISGVISLAFISLLIYLQGFYYWLHQPYLIFSTIMLGNYAFYYYSDKLPFREAPAAWIYRNQPAGKLAVAFCVISVVLLFGYSI